MYYNSYTVGVESWIEREIRPESSKLKVSWMNNWHDCYDICDKQKVFVNNTTSETIDVYHGKLQVRV